MRSARRARRAAAARRRFQSLHLVRDDLVLDLCVRRFGDDLLLHQLVLRLVWPTLDDLLRVSVADPRQCLQLLLAGGVQVELLGLVGRRFLVGGLRLGECDGRGEQQGDGDGDGAEQLGHVASRRGNPARPSNTRQEIASARETCSFAATNFFWSASTWTAYRSANSTAACAVS